MVKRGGSGGDEEVEDQVVMVKRGGSHLVVVVKRWRWRSGEVVKVVVVKSWRWAHILLGSISKLVIKSVVIRKIWLHQMRRVCESAGNRLRSLRSTAAAQQRNEFSQFTAVTIIEFHGKSQVSGLRAHHCSATCGERTSARARAAAA